jgi:hypothetical protein
MSMLRSVKGTVIVPAIVFGLGFFLGGQRLVSALPENRVYEIRTYTVQENGKLDALVARMRNGEAKLFDKSGMKGVLFSVAAEAPKSANTFVYIVAHKSLDAAKQSWAKFREDPDWIALRDKSAPTGPITVDSIFVNPVDFSPMK